MSDLRKLLERAREFIVDHDAPRNNYDPLVYFIPPAEALRMDEERRRQANDSLRPE